MSTSNVAASVPSAARAERTGIRQYVSRNSSGAKVRIGIGPGEFSPGELMKTVLVIRDTLSVDHRPAKALGEDFEVTVGCLTVKNNAGERYESLQVEIITNLSSFDTEQRELLSQRVAGVVDCHCTMGHIIEHDVSYIITIADPSEG